MHTFTLVRVPRNPAFKDEIPIYYINVILDEGVIVESRLVGDTKEKVKMGDRVKAVFQETHDPKIKLPCFELAECLGCSFGVFDGLRTSGEVLK